MRNSDQPSVFINFNNYNPSSAYDSANNEIIVDDGDYMNALLYHEYRHYLQHKALHFNKYYQKYREWFYGNWSFDAMLLSLALIQNTIITIPLACFIVVFTFPRLIMELDANVFAIKRLKRKKIKGQYKVLLIGMFSYIFSYLIIPLLIILL